MKNLIFIALCFQILFPLNLIKTIFLKLRKFYYDKNLNFAVILVNLFLFVLNLLKHFAGLKFTLFTTQPDSYNYQFALQHSHI